MAEKISVVIKPTSAQGSVKYTLEVLPSATVSELMGLLANHANIPSTEQRLIYKGQILKHESTLESYGIAHEHVIHLVRSRAASSSTPAPAPVATPAPAPAQPLGAMPMMGFGGNPMEMANNPEMMQQMMNNPMVQSMLTNPDLMRNLLGQNPAVQQLIESNPELGAMLNDPAVLRQSLQIAANPALMREHMRHADRAMSNLESMPEGFNALRRMFETVQEPLMAAASGMDPMGGILGGTAGAAAAGAGSDAAGPQGADGAAGAAGTATPNAAPLPNPWAPAAAAGAPAAAPLGLGGGLGGGGRGAAPGGMPFPDLSMLTQAMQRPGMREMMSSLMSNPAFMDSIMNPQMRQMVETTPGMRAALSNQASLEAMLNPSMLQAVAAMQQGNPQMQQMLQGMGGANPQMMQQMLQGMGGAANPQMMQQMLQGMGGGGLAGGPDLSSLMNSMNMFGPMAGAGGFGAPVPAADPQTQYAAQLSALGDMGFTDTAANVRALQATGGNVHAAVDHLLSGL